MPRRERQETKTLIQQRQEKQRGLTVQLRPPVTDSSIWNRVPGPPRTWPGEPLKVGLVWHEPRPSAFETPAPTPAQVGEAVDRLLAPLPRHGEPLTPAQDAALDLLDRLASDLIQQITDPASVHALIDRLPDLGTGCGRAVANALREAQ